MGTVQPHSPSLYSRIKNAFYNDINFKEKAFTRAFSGEHFYNDIKNSGKALPYLFKTFLSLGVYHIVKVIHSNSVFKTLLQISIFAAENPIQSVGEQNSIVFFIGTKKVELIEDALKWNTESDPENSPARVTWRVILKIDDCEEGIYEGTLIDFKKICAQRIMRNTELIYEIADVKYTEESLKKINAFLISKDDLPQDVGEDNDVIILDNNSSDGSAVFLPFDYSISRNNHKSDSRLLQRFNDEKEVNESGEEAANYSNNTNIDNSVLLINDEQSENASLVAMSNEQILLSGLASIQKRSQLIAMQNPQPVTTELNDAQSNCSESDDSSALPVSEIKDLERDGESEILEVQNSGEEHLNKSESSPDSAINNANNRIEEKEVIQAGLSNVETESIHNESDNSSTINITTEEERKLDGESETQNLNVSNDTKDKLNSVNRGKVKNIPVKRVREAKIVEAALGTNNEPSLTKTLPPAFKDTVTEDTGTIEIPQISEDMKSDFKVNLQDQQQVGGKSLITAGVQLALTNGTGFFDANGAELFPSRVAMINQLNKAYTSFREKYPDVTLGDTRGWLGMGSYPGEEEMRTHFSTDTLSSLSKVHSVTDLEECWNIVLQMARPTVETSGDPANEPWTNWFSDEWKAHFTKLGKFIFILKEIYPSMKK